MIFYFNIINSFIKIFLNVLIGKLLFLYPVFLASLPICAALYVGVKQDPEELGKSVAGVFIGTTFLIMFIGMILSYQQLIHWHGKITMSVLKNKYFYNFYNYLMLLQWAKIEKKEESLQHVDSAGLIKKAIRFAKTKDSLELSLYLHDNMLSYFKQNNAVSVAKIPLRTNEFNEINYFPYALKNGDFNLLLENLLFDDFVHSQKV